MVYKLGKCIKRLKAWQRELWGVKRKIITPSFLHNFSKSVQLINVQYQNIILHMYRRRIIKYN